MSENLRYLCLKFALTSQTSSKNIRNLLPKFRYEYLQLQSRTSEIGSNHGGTKLVILCTCTQDNEPNLNIDFLIGPIMTRAIQSHHEV